MNGIFRKTLALLLSMAVLCGAVGLCFAEEEENAAAVPADVMLCADNDSDDTAAGDESSPVPADAPAREEETAVSAQTGNPEENMPEAGENAEITADPGTAAEAGSFAATVEESREGNELTGTDPETEIPAEAEEETEATVKAAEEAGMTAEDIAEAEAAADAVEEAEAAADAVEEAEATADAVEEAEATADAVEEAEATVDAVEEAEATVDAVEESEATVDAVEESEATVDAVEESEATVEAAEEAEATVDAVLEAEATAEATMDAGEFVLLPAELPSAEECTDAVALTDTDVYSIVTGEMIGRVKAGEALKVAMIGKVYSVILYSDCEEGAAAVRNSAIALYYTRIEDVPRGETDVRYITVTTNVSGMTNCYEGMLIVVSAKLHGFENDTYTLQWQYSPDKGLTAYDLPGENDTEYAYFLTEENYGYMYRLTVKYETADPVEEPGGEESVSADEADTAFPDTAGLLTEAGGCL